MNYKVGEKVRVRKDLVYDGSFFKVGVSEQMVTLRGKEFVIESVKYCEMCKQHEYGLKGNPWNWTGEMLEPVYEIGDKVRVIGVKDGYSNNETSQTVGSVGTVTEFPHKSFSHDFDVVEIDFVGHQTHVPVSCIEKVSDVEEERNCHNCKYRPLSGSDLPCCSCVRGRGAEEKWEPKDDIGIIPCFYSSIPLFNVVFVTHDSDNDRGRKYIFAVPHDVTIKKGDKLFADTRKGKKIVTAYTNSFKTDKAGLDAMDIMNGCHKGMLKMIVARAKRQEEWKEVPFK